MAKKAGLLGLIIGLMLLAGAVWKSVLDAGSLDKVWNHPLPACRLQKGVVGAEDLLQVPGTQRLLVAASDRQGLKPGSVNGIYVYDLARPEHNPQLLTTDTGIEWQAHGLSLWQDEHKTRVFAINHRPEQDHVEILDWVGERLELVRSLPFPGVKTLNSILALGPDKFFVTQDLGLQHAFGQLLEKYLRLPRGQVWLVDGQQVSPAATGILYANGLELSKDQKTLYVASMLGRSLVVFDHEPGSHRLQKRQEIFLNSAPDNLRWSADGRLLIGSHLDLLGLKQHSENAGHRAPSQVLAVAGLPGQAQIEELYSSQGEPLGAISTALQVGQELVMGAIYEEGLLICRLP